jgi:hypothetical protein
VKHARSARNLLDLQADKRYVKGKNYWLVLTRPSVAGFNAPIDSENQIAPHQGPIEGRI